MILNPPNAPEPPTKSKVKTHGFVRRDEGWYFDCSGCSLRALVPASEGNVEMARSFREFCDHVCELPQTHTDPAG